MKQRILPGEKHFTASVFLISDEPKPRTLLVFHRKFNKWMMPGGHIEVDENPLEAAIREVQEETGIDIRSYLKLPASYKEIIYLPLPDYLLEVLIPAHGDQPKHYHIDLSYVLHIPYAEPAPVKAETDQVRWFDKAELGDLDLFEDVSAVLTRILGKKK